MHDFKDIDDIDTPEASSTMLFVGARCSGTYLYWLWHQYNEPQRVLTSLNSPQDSFIEYICNGISVNILFNTVLKYFGHLLTTAIKMENMSRILKK